MTLAEEDGGGTGLSKIFLKYLCFQIFQKIFSCKRKMCSKDLLGSFRRVGVLVIAEEWTKMKQKFLSNLMNLHLNLHLQS